ncbi:MAG: hypothetical protein ACJARO_002213, partial [Bacteriovoracaceae bacterium]
MKKTLQFILIFTSLGFSALWASENYDQVLKSPTLFFKEVAKVMLQTPITWEEPNNQNLHLEKNTDKFLLVQKTINKQKGLNNRFGDEIQNIVDQNSVLNGHELHLLGKIIGASHSLSARALEYSSLYNLERNGPTPKVIYLEDLKKTKSNLVWLSTHVNLFGLYIDAYDHYYSNGKIRRIVKNIFKTRGMKNQKFKELGTMISHTTSKDNRKRLRKVLIEFNRNLPQLTNLAGLDDQTKDLIRSIQENPVTKILRSKESLSFKSHSFIDGFMTFLDKSMNILSAFFGNSVGAVRWRKGYLNNNLEVISFLKKNLRPLDMIFEKTPFALTDTFIPGNFGHAAIYIGSKTQLIKIGMWNHPKVIPYHETLNKGHVIVEALRPGVRTASIKEWMNIDEVLVLRHPQILNDKDEVYRMYSRIMDQIGKKYDFNFDVTTTDKVVCSELIYHAYGKINWPTKYIMGRATISPDDVAQVVLYKNSPIKFTSYLLSPRKSVVKVLDMDQLADKLGFKKNKQRSTAVKASYDQVIRK